MEESRAHGNGMHIGFQDFCIFIAVLDPAISWSTATVEVIEVDQWLCSFEEQDEREGHPDVIRCGGPLESNLFGVDQPAYTA